MNRPLPSSDLTMRQTGHPSERPRVFVTGIGLVTPLGGDRETSWERVRRGKCGLDWLTESRVRLPLHLAQFSTAPGLRAAGEALRYLSPAKWSDDSGRSEAPANDPLVQMVTAAAREAWRDACLDARPAPPERTGCAIGASKGGLLELATRFQADRQAALQPARTAGLPESHVDRLDVASDLARYFGSPSGAGEAVVRELPVRGPFSCPVAACATGVYSMELGASWIREGIVDVVLVGSGDCSIHPALLASFHRLGVLARNFVDPQRACRPFDESHEGFLVGEGAGVIVLESDASVESRQASVYAEVLGGALGSDPAGITQLDASGQIISSLVDRALTRNRLAPAHIDLVNVHGTATEANDSSESRAIAALFGADPRHLSCTAFKGQLGHLLGAAGSVELGLTILSMRDQWVPSVFNLETPAPGCRLPSHPGSRPVQRAVKLSLGFGGHHAVSVLERPDSRDWPLRSPMPL